MSFMAAREHGSKPGTGGHTSAAQEVRSFGTRCSGGNGDDCDDSFLVFPF